MKRTFQGLMCCPSIIHTYHFFGRLAKNIRLPSTSLEKSLVDIPGLHTHTPRKSMRTPMYCYKFTCVSLSSVMYLRLPSRSLLVHVGTFTSDVDPNLVRFEHSEAAC
jgi:hypothetical protein